MDNRKRIALNDDLFYKIKEEADKNNQSIESFLSDLLNKKSVITEDKILIDYADLQTIIDNQNRVKHNIEKIIDLMFEMNSIKESDLENLQNLQKKMTEQTINSVQKLIQEQSKTKAKLQKFIQKRR